RRGNRTGAFVFHHSDVRFLRDVQRVFERAQAPQEAHQSVMVTPDDVVEAQRLCAALLCGIRGDGVDDGAHSAMPSRRDALLAGAPATFVPLEKSRTCARGDAAALLVGAASTAR